MEAASGAAGGRAILKLGRNLEDGLERFSHQRPWPAARGRPGGPDHETQEQRGRDGRDPERRAKSPLRSVRGGSPRSTGIPGQLPSSLTCSPSPHHPSERRALPAGPRGGRSRGVRAGAGPVARGGLHPGHLHQSPSWPLGPEPGWCSTFGLSGRRCVKAGTEPRPILSLRGKILPISQGSRGRPAGAGLLTYSSRRVFSSRGVLHPLFSPVWTASAEPQGPGPKPRPPAAGCR